MIVDIILFPIIQLQKLKLHLVQYRLEVYHFDHKNKSDGIIKVNLSPTTINCTPSVHPGITLLRGNVAWFTPCTELSKIVPSVNLPV